MVTGRGPGFALRVEPARSQATLSKVVLRAQFDPPSACYAYTSTFRMTSDIIRKLKRELDSGITTEVQVVYLLAGIRKLIERDKSEEQYQRLKFHCDWALHSSMDRAAAKAILKQFDSAHALLRENIELHALPGDLRNEIDRISQMEYFEAELSQFLAAYDLPPLTKHRSDGWIHFLHLFTKVIEDIPLVVSVPAKKKPKSGTTESRPKHISHVTVHFELAKETVKHADGEDVLFKVTWTVHDKNGHSGDLFILNSFSLRP
jgi:hypothetical protein